MSGNRFMAIVRIFALSFLISLNSWASLSKTKANIKRLKASVSRFDKIIKTTNSQFSKVIDLKDQLFSDVNNIEQEIESTDLELDRELKVFKKTLLRYEALDDSVEENEFKLLSIKSLENKKKKILNRKTHLKELRKNLLKIQDKISDYEFLEVDLIKKIEDINLKSQKARNDLAKENKKYVSLRKVVKKKDLILEKKKIVQEQKNRSIKKQKKNISNKSQKIVGQPQRKISITLPISKDRKIEEDGTGGLNFIIGPKEKITAPSGGVVIYSGRLSKYGNVIVIKHSDGYRSVILGKFISSVIKGQNVNTGQKIATSLETLSKEDRIYFELRKNKKKLNAKKYVTSTL